MAVVLVLCFVAITGCIFVILYWYAGYVKPVQKLSEALENADFSAEFVDLTDLDNLQCTGSKSMRFVTQRIKELVDVVEDRVDKVGDALFEAEHDSLTGLYNRAYLNRVKSRYEVANLCGVIFIDVNNLKRMNDVFGHEAGDALLKNAARHLRFWEKLGDVYRLGGDEFMVVVLGMQEEKLKKILERWYSTVGCLNRESDGFRCVLSYGISFAVGGGNFGVLEKEADDKMYKMKTELKKRFGEPLR